MAGQVGAFSRGVDWNYSSHSYFCFKGILKTYVKFMLRPLNHSSNIGCVVKLPLVAVGTFTGGSVISLVAQVALVGERAIKGVTNLLSGVYSWNRFRTTTGLYQLLLMIEACSPITWGCPPISEPEPVQRMGA